jgi:hypothetical protein
MSQVNAAHASCPDLRTRTWFFFFFGLTFAIFRENCQQADRQLVAQPSSSFIKRLMDTPVSMMALIWNRR